MGQGPVLIFLLAFDTEFDVDVIVDLSRAPFVFVAVVTGGDLAALSLVISYEVKKWE